MTKRHNILSLYNVATFYWLQDTTTAWIYGLIIIIDNITNQCQSIFCIKYRLINNNKTNIKLSLFLVLPFKIKIIMYCNWMDTNWMAVKLKAALYLCSIYRQLFTIEIVSINLYWFFHPSPKTFAKLYSPLLSKTKLHWYWNWRMLDDLFVHPIEVTITMVNFW